MRNFAQFLRRHSCRLHWEPSSNNARTIAVELIESLRPKGEYEFVRDFAEKLPIIVFLRMMDLPLDDREYLLGVSHQNIGTSKPEVRVLNTGENFGKTPRCVRRLLKR